MAIQKRLLSKLRSIYVAFNMASEGKLREVHVILQRMTEVQSLCRKGLPQGAYSKYEEIYDGIIMAIKQILSGKAAGEKQEIISLCKDLLQHIVVETGKESRFKKEVVFLPYKASMWDSLESVWRAAAEDKENCLPYVIPIPYCDRNPDGTAREWYCERESFPRDVPTLDWQTVDLKNIHPEVVFIHNCYDDCNKVTSVDEVYYSRNLKECTDKLVYIPYFVLGEPELHYGSMEKAEKDSTHYIVTPAVLNSDLTIVQSETIREVYVNVLNRNTNAPMKYWEEHILGLGSPKFDKVLNSKRDDYKLPVEWMKIINGRRTIMYNTGLTAMLKHTDRFLEKVRSVLKLFKGKRGVVLWWRPHPLLKSTAQSMHPELLQAYNEIVDTYIQEGWGIYDETEDLDRAIVWTDGYYGDWSSVVWLYEKTGKPIMIQEF